MKIRVEIAKTAVDMMIRSPGRLLAPGIRAGGERYEC